MLDVLSPHPVFINNVLYDAAIKSLPLLAEPTESLNPGLCAAEADVRKALALKDLLCHEEVLPSDLVETVQDKVRGSGSLFSS